MQSEHKLGKENNKFKYASVVISKDALDLNSEQFARRLQPYGFGVLPKIQGEYRSHQIYTNICSG